MAVGNLKGKKLFTGTVHGEDFTLMMSFPMRSFRSDEEILSRKFIKMLEDFIKEG